ncbi:YhgE/Pip domain-containing protein [Enorma burkinafasonensis]|uniref:YhgE/Pip domain-containing protein n=1 Tax=Enorma burkinafasonensis TaxID=2590867 RepID=UPI0011A21410|nr:YhgE/Pip domain-containing protein [Enorma burkinafasonensis]
MTHLLALLRHDIRKLGANAVTIVVVAGIIAVPSFYAWFNIAGSWDPYGSTRNVTVAVANADEGYEGELVPVRLNLGDRVVSELIASESIGYVAVSKDEALEGVRSGAYYAAVVIPEDFSACLLSGFGGQPRRAQVLFYQNEKANAIATIVTDKAGAAVERSVDEGFTQAVTDVGAGAATELADALGDDRLADIARGLDGSLADAAASLADAAGQARSLAGFLASTQDLLAGSSRTLGAALEPLAGTDDALRDAAGDLGGVRGALDGASSSVAGALDGAASGMDAVDAALDDAFAAAGDQVEGLEGALSQAQAAIDDQAAGASSLAAAVADQAAAARDLAAALPEGGTAQQKVAAAAEALDGLAGRLGKLNESLTDLSEGIGRTVDDLAQGKTDAEGARRELAGLVEDAREELGQARDAYTGAATGTLDDLAAAVGVPADALEGAGAGLDETASAVDSALTATAGSLGDVQGTLGEAAQRLDEGADGLEALRGRIAAADHAGDADALRAVLATSPTALAAFVSRPVALDRTAIFPVENNGSAMAPFYTTLSIWIGGVVLAALVRALPSERARRETGCSTTQAYLARLALFAGIGLLQATLIWAGDVLYLEVQCAHPALFLVACWVASLAFVGIIHALTASFGDVGKAIAVVLMVVQVAGAGGTFPEQMLPVAFQHVYRWLPFVHAEGAMRAALFGLWGADYPVQLALTAAYLVPALLLGIAGRRPVMRLTAWMEEELERTRVM